MAAGEALPRPRPLLHRHARRPGRLYGRCPGRRRTANGAPWPEAEIPAARHRLRLLNASNARRYHLRLELEGGGPLPVTQIGGDAGLLGAPQRLDAVPLAPAERFDVVVDFSHCPVGSHVTLVNTVTDGRMRQVMRFRVTRKAKDASHVPARLSSYAPLAPAAVATRHFDFRRTDNLWTINGRPFSATRPWPTRASAPSNAGV